MKPVIRKIEMMVERSGMLVGEFTSAAGLAVNRYSKWRDGKGEPRVSQLVRIARVLNVPIDWLADDDQPIDAVPEPKWTREELLVLEAIRTIGTHEALRRLLNAPPPAPAASGPEASGLNLTPTYFAPSGISIPPAIGVSLKTSVTSCTRQPSRTRKLSLCTVAPGA